MIRHGLDILTFYHLYIFIKSILKIISNFLNIMFANDEWRKCKTKGNIDHLMQQKWAVWIKPTLTAQVTS